MPRAFVFSEYGGPDVSHFAEVPRPAPAEGEVLVAIRASGVNPADWKGRRGPGQGVPPEVPMVMGREFAGSVVDVGPGVDGFAVGDEVFGVPARGGSYAEFGILSTGQMARKPPQLSFLEAATLGVAGATAYDAITQLDPQAGETLLVIGAGGGVGVLIVQLAARRGTRVLGTSSPTKRGLVESLGAIHIPYGEGVVEAIEAAAPDGVDAIFDTVGGAALREVGPSLEDRARLCSIGDPAAAEELGGKRLDRKRNSEVLEAIGRLTAEGVVMIPITEVFPFDEAAEALALVEAGHATGEIVLEIA